MTFEGIDNRGLYRFALARKHQGDAFYKGCSGSPIAAPDGTIVALVQGGAEMANEIYGVPLARYAKYALV